MRFHQDMHRYLAGDAIKGRYFLNVSDHFFGLRVAGAFRDGYVAQHLSCAGHQDIDILFPSGVGVIVYACAGHFVFVIGAG